MRAHEIYESEILESGISKITALEMARHVLVPQYDFKEYTRDRMFVKYISDTYYITAQCWSSAFTLALFNRKTMKTDDIITIESNTRNDDFIGFREKHQILNKLVEWTKQFSDTDPRVEEAVTNIAEASNLDINSTNAETQDVIKLIMHVMKSKGYKGKRVNQSAMFDVTFEGLGPQITIDGWHGNGKYGRGIVLFTVYKDHKPIFDMPVNADDLDNTKRGEYWASEDKKQAYLDGLVRVKQMFQSGSIFK